MASESSFEESRMFCSSDDRSVDWDDTSTLDFWLGSKFFQLELSQHVVGSISGDRTFSELESALHERLRDYPYDKHLSALRVQVPSSLLQNSSEGYEGFLGAIGAVIRNGCAKDKEILFQIMKSRSDEELRDSFEARTPDLDRGSPASPLHVMALKQYGDQIGEAPKYATEIACLHPSKTKVTLKFQGWQTEVEAKSKKEAQRKAAMEACRKFKIQNPYESSA